MYQIATKGPEKQAVGRAGAGGAASLARPAPRTAGPLASSAGAEARSNEEEGGARDLLLDVKAGPREFAQVGQVERGGRVCS